VLYIFVGHSTYPVALGFINIETPHVVSYLFFSFRQSLAKIEIPGSEWPHYFSKRSDYFSYYFKPADELQDDSNHEAEPQTAND
jgi:hypothetical protein